MNRDLQKRVIFGALALAVFLPLVVMGGVAYQLFIGFLAMISTAELLKMKRLSPSSIEGILAMLAALVGRKRSSGNAASMAKDRMEL